MAIRGARPETRVRILSLNLQHGMMHDGVDRVADEAELARALAPLAAWRPDVVTLQEVDHRQPRSGGVDQAAVVARALGLPHVQRAHALHGDVRRSRNRAPAVLAEQASARRSAGGEVRVREDAAPGYGLAILTHLPVLATFALPLPLGPGRWPAARSGRIVLRRDEPRVMAAAVLDVAGRELAVGTMHASTIAPVALRQVRTATRSMAALAPSRVLTGDFNLRRGSVGVVSDEVLASRGLTYPAWAPVRGIDHILTGGLRLPEGLGSPLPALTVADHLPIGAVLEVI